MTNPERNESELTFSRRLEELDKSLQDIRLKHEEELKQIKTANAKFLSNLTKTQQETLNKLDLDSSGNSLEVNGTEETSVEDTEVTVDENAVSNTEETEVTVDENAVSNTEETQVE